jgi:hypothetical protein
LKNENNILPLSKELKKIAVIGPLADSKRDPLGGWVAQGDPKMVVTVLNGIKNKLGGKVNIEYAEGCKITGDDRSGFEQAVKAVESSEAAIVVAGESERIEREAFSRSSLDLPGVQEDLIKELHKTGKPIIVVLMNGRPLSIPWLQKNVPAILETWFAEFKQGMRLPMSYSEITTRTEKYRLHSRVLSDKSQYITITKYRKTSHTWCSFHFLLYGFGQHSFISFWLRIKLLYF